ncbi:tetratricopeptide repeat protein [Alloacidobacterium sp.]|uniref:tetratricopeptide repeat protein n=1 Tax=Alloacidobacterium sp. TaxID=2951999 RepID=UPI002D341BBF|nr:tetratricopeptide repeat protein [Alloacidobacterium sp.]HYK34674.1 tetratricopeptide repeat protein [Alloacidobacterium sp.]
MIGNSSILRASICSLTILGCLSIEPSIAQTNTLFPAPIDTRDANREANLANGQLKDELKLAGNYMMGRGVARDVQQAAYWYHKAADQGFPPAQVQLGYFYLTGLGVPKDDAQAAKWFERAAASGSYEGKLNIAVMYFRGTGIVHDPHMGYVLLKELANKQYPRAEDYLGIAYMLGLGIEKDEVAAEKWFERAASHHSPEGEYSMGTLYSVQQGHAHDFNKAADYLRSSAEAGYVAGMHSYGLMLVNHPEVGQQPGEAVHWLESGAAGGAYRSSIVLGVLARDGRSIPKDEAAAYQWFIIAVKQGGEAVEKLLAADLTLARKTLSEDQQKTAEHAATAWMSAHPHQDIYVHGSELNYAYFPLNEVYATGLDIGETDKGENRN